LSVKIHLIPSYLDNYLKHIGAASTDERILVEASDGSGILSFKRMDHHTEVFDSPEMFMSVLGEVVDGNKY